MSGKIKTAYKKVQRERLRKRDGEDCQLCGLPFAEDETPTIDHIVPRGRGGDNHINNLQLAHAACNERKADESQWDRWKRLNERGDLTV